MKDLNQRFYQTMKLSEVIKDFVTEKYEVPIHEIPIWIENGWKFDEAQNKMHRKGRESVNVQQSKAK
jgi:hypothetical protein